MNPRPVPAGSQPDLGAYENELGSPVTGISSGQINISEYLFFHQSQGVFKVKGPDINKFMVYNTLGNLVLLSDSISGESVEINLKGNPPGIYVVRILLKNNNSVVRKVILM